MQNRNSPQDVCYTIITTVRGSCGLVWSHTATKPVQLLRLFPACPDAERLRRSIRKEFQVAKWSGDHKARLPVCLRPLAGFLMAYYAGDINRAVKLQPDWPWLRKHLPWADQNEFGRKVLAATFNIKAGTTISYKKLALRIGRPRAARAVGGALARNPWPILIPCHRVLGSDGSMTGFSGYGAVVAKRWMLEMERSCQTLYR